MAYFDEYGVEFSDDRKTLVRCPQNYQGKYEIPLGTTYVADSAFSNCSQLTAVSIPDSVTRLGWDAFIHCSNLVTINFPDSIVAVGRNTFTGCESIEAPVYNATLFAYMPPTFIGAYIIPSGITYIACHAFFGCQNITKISIPDSVIGIGDEAFKNCDNLTTIVLDADYNQDCLFATPELFGEQVNTILIGSHVTNLRLSALPHLVSINVSDDNSNYCSIDGVLFSKDKTKLVKYPANKESLSYEIPNSVLNVASGAFVSCSGLTSITIPNSVTSIESAAFRDCTKLTSVTIPDGITSIEDHTFQGCSGLTSVTIPNSVTSIGTGAFMDCTNLISVDIPNSVTSIGSEVFSNCTGLKSIKLSNNITRIPGNDYDGLSQSYAGCLWFCKNLKKLYIPDGVTKIECRVIYGCSSLTTISIPRSVSKVEKYALDGCKNLTEIYVPLGDEERFCKMEGLLKYADIIRQTSERYRQREAEEQRLIEIQQRQEMLYGSILFFDTETTGILPGFNIKRPVTDSYNWPRLVQLAWIITDNDGKVLKQQSHIIIPEGFRILDDAVAVHHITTERARQEGQLLRVVLEEFLSDLELAERAICHNVKFDKGVVGAELYRLGMDYDVLMSKSSICTMTSKSIIDYCALPNPNEGYNDYKWPRLPELYRILFKREFEDAHDALADITATKDCFFELKRRGII